MVLSRGELEARYSQFNTFTKVRKMIEDMVDTHIIMEEVRQYGREKYAAGQRDNQSRHDWPDETGR